jgi:hypothetical protein
METFQEPLDNTEGIDPSWKSLLRSIIEHRWPWRGEYVMPILDAFQVGVCADESGIHDEAPICILAGYIASVKQWIWFDARWVEVLEKFDVGDFHSKDFFAVDSSGKRVGKYRRWSDRATKESYGDWSDAKASDFLVRLLAAVHNTRMEPLGAYVQTDVFSSFTYGERKYLTGGKFRFDNGQIKWLTSGAPTKPYFLIYDHCLAEATQRTKPGHKALFIFDQQKTFEGRALQQFGETAAVLSQAPEGWGKRFAGVLFQERHEVPGLQAADLYTHCWYRYVVTPDALGPRYGALDTLTMKVPGMKFYTKEHLQGLFRNMPPQMLEAVRTWED